MTRYESRLETKHTKIHSLVTLPRLKIGLCKRFIFEQKLKKKMSSYFSFAQVVSLVRTFNQKSTTSVGECPWTSASCI